MANTKTLDERIKNNIKDYDLNQVLDIKLVEEQITLVAKMSGAAILLTDRHGACVVCAGDVQDKSPDVEKNPGRKIRVANRTVAHLYAQTENCTDAALADSLIDNIVSMLSLLGEQTYRYTEASIYAGEVGDKKAHTEKLDPLTGVFNTTYFKKRMEIIDRSEVAPVAVIEANINDWRYANVNFGDEGSDNLIRIVADILKKESKPEYVIGRTDGDVFVILIPMPEEGEAEDYVNRIQSACDSYDDTCLTPSVACGLVYKENVEEKIPDKISDAEYMMFENKLEIKESPEYQARLHRAEA